MQHQRFCQLRLLAERNRDVTQIEPQKVRISVVSNGSQITARRITLLSVERDVCS
jgi:hypothetical protein